MNRGVLMNRAVAAVAVGLVALGALGVSAAIGPAPAALAAPGNSSAPAYYFDQWSLQQLWASGASGQGITIGEIDTGVDGSLAIFDGRVEPGVDFGTLGGDGRIDRDKDAFGHGTSMASIMVGRPGAFDIQGIAPGARLLPVAIPLSGTTDAAPDDRLATATRWSADHGAKIISMSLGGVRRPAQFRTACPDDEQQAIFYALNKGALVFAASGNRGADGSPVEEPSVCLGVVSVGAVNSYGAVADFSSRHRYLTLSAPGVSIPSIAPSGTPYAGDGTSQATAIASAATALVWSKYPTLTSSQVLARVLATLDRPTSGHDPGFGYGIINPQRAVTASVPRAAPDPVFAAVQPFLQHASAAPSRTVPAAIAKAARPPGRYSVGAAPRLLAPRVVAGIALAAGGLVLLLILIVGGRISLARRRAAARPPTPPSGPVHPPPAIPPPPTSPWQHDVWAPEAHRPGPE